MIAGAIRKRLKTALMAASAVLICAGCGGGGGGTTATPTEAGVGSYMLVAPVSREIGVAPVTLVCGGATLEASLPATTTVTITERFYTSGRPGGVAGKIYDIKPDGLAFKPGTRLCISYAEAEAEGYLTGELTLVTGERLDQELASTLDGSRGSICATLQHSSPYGMARVMSLRTPDYTFFGGSNTKTLYPIKVTSASEIDDEVGPVSVTKILVRCTPQQCLESGERTFKVAQSGTHAGELYIRDEGAYPMWQDMENLKWMPFKNEQGAILAGIPYLLASEYMALYAGGSPIAGYAAQLDPADNRIQRFFYYENQTAPYLYIEIIREDSTAPSVIRAQVNHRNSPIFNYVINRTTAAITKSWISPVDGPQSVMVSPGDAAYADINLELLYNIYTLIGMDDTPDYKAGNAWDAYARYTPNQELFAVNVMNLLKGFGWNNINQIEIYYRDRLKAMQDPAR
ncbi:MAG: hypothetical protein WCX65_11955 [bacterium]